MTRYYFHFRDSEGRLEDDMGIEFRSDSDALKEAHLAARGILAEQLTAGEAFGADIIDVVNEDGKLIGQVSFNVIIENAFGKRGGNA